MALSITVTKIPASITARPIWLRYPVALTRLTGNRTGTSRLMANGPRACGAACRNSGDLDLIPKAEPSADVLQSRTRRLIGPRRAFISNAVDDHIVELNAVRTGKVCLGLRRLLEKLQSAWPRVGNT